jgi:DNA-binding CsgD family transcriptional regulator
MSPSRNKPRARTGDPLTRREIEVLGLVAAGETTAAIARHLAISENTVKGHLTHVYAKTGSRNRVQATRHYLDHHTTSTPQGRSSQPASDGRKEQRP